MSITVSWLRNRLVSVPEQRAVEDFAGLIAFIGEHRAYPSKESVPQFAPAEWAPGERKTAKNVVRVHFGVLDYDEAPENDLVALLAGLETDHLFVSSWSHGDPEKNAKSAKHLFLHEGTKLDPRTAFLLGWAGSGGGGGAPLVRGRLVVPFSRPVEALEWPRFWPRFAAAHERGLARPDVQCKDPSHAYHLPSHPVVPFTKPIWLSSVGGRVFDVDRLLGPQALSLETQKIAAAIEETRDPPRGQQGPVPATHDLTRHELRELSNKLAKSSSKGKQEMAVALRAVCNGEAFAEHGNHDNMLYRIACTITEKWPYASAESVATLLAPSLQDMSPGESLEWALEKLRRKKAEVRERVEIDRASRCAEFFSGQRDTPYSNDEIRQFEEQVDAPMQRRWVVQRGKSYFLFSGKPNGDGTCHGGNYDARFSNDDVINAARVVLAPAASVGVTLDVVTEKGARPKTPAELVRDYGVVAKSHVADLAAEYSYYDNETGIFIEAPCPMREIHAKEHPMIDQWLRLMAGDRARQLLEWIAWVTYLRRPAAALYMEGPPGAGKTLLPCGLARLWSKQGPVSLEDCFGNFNAGILKCPLIFGDEVAPKDFHGKVRTGEIREFIQAKQRPLRRKYVDSDTVSGAVRLVFAANNTELLSSNEHLTVNDIAALTERFLHIPVQEAAAIYLRSLRENARTRHVIEAWVEQDQIAEHALFLRDTIPLRDTSRLLASTHEASPLTTSLTIGTGIRSAVLHWLVLYLLDPSRLSQNAASNLIRVYNGRLAVNTRIFAEAWDTYRTNIAAPSAGRIAQAVAGLAVGQRVHLRDRNGKEVWYREINTANLVAWAEENGYASGQHIREILQQMAAQQGAQVNRAVN